jgi:hypothetical protein
MAASKFIKYFFIVTTLGLTACDIKKPTQMLLKNGASFEVKSFEGKSISVNMHADIAIPVSNNYNFRACITNVRLKTKPVVGHKFLIEEVKKEVTTDIEGCVNWSETITYNFLAQSKYLSFERTLVAKGLHRGRRTINFALDPWSHGDDKPKEAVDLKKNTSLPDNWLIRDKDAVMAALNGNTLDTSPHARSIWIETGRINSQEDRITNKGFEITYEVHGNPQIILTRVNGNKVLYDIVSGNFSAEMQLIHVVHKDGKIHRTVLAEKRYDTVRVSNKNLALKARFNYKAPYWGHLYIGVKLAAQKAPQGLRPFEGLYYVGDYRSIKANGWLKISSLVQNNRGFTLSQFLNGDYEDADAINEDSANLEDGTRGEQQDFDGKNRIFVRPLRFEFLNGEDDIGHRRKIRYQVEACVINPIDNQEIRGLKFNVIKFRQNEKEPAQHPQGNPLTSQINGCFTWTEELSVEMYDCQKYVKGFIDIENSDLGMKQRVHYYMNPWLTTPLFGVDELIVKNSVGKECEGAKDAEKPRYIFINNFEYSLQHMGYELDSNQTLMVHRYAKVDIDAKVVNNSDLMFGRSGSMPLRDGMYLVKMFITTNPGYTDKFEYNTSATRLARARGGRISINYVDFLFRDVFDIGNRNSILLQILPVDETKVESHKVKPKHVDIKNPDATYTDYSPKSGDLDSVVDQKVTLTPIIYEGKILMLGTERGSFALHDSNADLIVNIDDLKDQKSLEKLQGVHQERMTLINKLVAQGQMDIQKASTAISEASTLESYAKHLDAELADFSEGSGQAVFLQRLASLPLQPILRPILRPMLPGEDKLMPTQKRYLEQINNAKLAATSKEEVLKALASSKIETELARRLCVYWINQVISPVLNPLSIGELTRKCIQGSDEYISHLFLNEKFYFTRKLNNFSYQAGIWERMGLSSTFAMTNSNTRSLSQSWSVSSKAGATFKFLEFFSMGLDGQFLISKSKADSEAQSNTINVSNSVDLEKQRNTFSVDLLDYDVCHRIRINPSLFRGQVSYFKNSDLWSHLKLKMRGEEVINTISRSFFVCSKPQNQAPLSLSENFYIVQERLDNREYQDGGDKRNRRLFVTLRGDSDFKRFEHLMKNGVVMPDGFYLDELTSEQINLRILQTFNLRPSAPNVFIESPLKN